MEVWCLPLDVKSLGKNYSKKESLRKPKRIKLTLLGKTEHKRKKRAVTRSRGSSMYSGAFINPESRAIFNSSITDVDPINELALTRALIYEVLRSKDASMRKSLPNLIRTVGELYDKIRRGVDGMRVVVSFKDGKFSREVTDNLSGEIHKLLEALSEGMCDECRESFRSNVLKYVGDMSV
jgi:hypothetical protein